MGVESRVIRPIYGNNRLEVGDEVVGLNLPAREAMLLNIERMDLPAREAMLLNIERMDLTARDVEVMRLARGPQIKDRHRHRVRPLEALVADQRQDTVLAVS